MLRRSELAGPSRASPQRISARAVGQLTVGTHAASDANGVWWRSDEITIPEFVRCNRFVLSLLPVACATDVVA